MLHKHTAPCIKEKGWELYLMLLLVLSRKKSRALGDGGCVVTNNKDIADKVRALGNYGSDYKYHHIYKGNNSRLDEMQAAFLRCNLPYLDKWNIERKNSS